MDHDEMILEAAFKVLVDFCETKLRVRPEDQPAYDLVDDEISDQIIRARLADESDFWDLYDWWTLERPTRLVSEGEDPDFDWQGQFYEDQRQLRRLVELRVAMWA